MHPAIENLIKSGRVDKGMWWEKAWRLVEGCQKVSPGCTHCWSERQAHLRSGNPKMQAQYGGVTTPDGKWNGKIKLLEQNLKLPLKRKKPTVWAIWNDLFHESVGFEVLLGIFYLISQYPQHIFIILTKRPESAKEFFELVANNYTGKVIDHVLPWDILKENSNIWLGVTAENQAQADKRIPILLQIPAAVRFVSIEPMLGPVDLSKILLQKSDGGVNGNKPDITMNALLGWNGGANRPERTSLNWVILGGESGPGARPLHPDWARGVRDQCVEAGTPFFFKQWGEWIQSKEPMDVRNKKTGSFETLPAEQCFVKVGKKAAGRILGGLTWEQFPEVNNE